MKNLISLIVLSFCLSSSAATFPAFTNGVVRYVSINGNNSTALTGIRERPWAHITNALAVAKPGDTIQVMDNGPYVFTNSWLLPTNSTVDMGYCVVTNAIQRGSDNQDLTSQLSCFVLSDNCQIRNCFGIGQPTLNLICNCPFIGTFYQDKAANVAQDPCATNWIVENITTRKMTGFYIRHTNSCTGTLKNCQFIDTVKQAGFVSFGLHNIEYWDCKFSVVGPDPFQTDSGVSAAQGIRILSGTNTFHNCSFSAFNPTNYLAANSPSNAMAFEIEVGEGFFPTADCTACTFSSGNTNLVNNTNAYDIFNGGDKLLSFEQSPLTLHGCKFDRTKTLGGFVEDYIGATGGVTIGNDTNHLVITSGNDGAIASPNWATDVSVAVPLTYTNENGYIINGVSGAWEMTDNFATILYSNLNTTVLGPWTVCSGGLPLPVPIVRYKVATTTNTFLVYPTGTAVSMNGSAVTNINAANIASGAMPSGRVPTTNLLAVVNAGTPATGQFGENFLAALASSAAVSFSTGTARNITNIVLTAGDWDVSGNVNYAGSTATITATSGGINTTSATLPTDGTEVYSGVTVTLVSETDSVTVPRKVINVSGSTTVYLVGKVTFSAGTVTGFGSLTARRVR